MSVELVVEDELSEALLRKILSSCAPGLKVGTVRITNGCGQIRKNLAAFNSLAKVRPVVVLTDQDDDECAPALINEWFENVHREPQLTFRVATREVESWVMADRARFAAFLGIQINLIPAYPDQLDDPKKVLLELASSATSRALRKAIVPAGKSAKIGPGYNDVLSAFVFSAWDPNNARQNSASLSRAIAAIQNI